MLGKVRRGCLPLLPFGLVDVAVGATAHLAALELEHILHLLPRNKEQITIWEGKKKNLL